MNEAGMRPWLGTMLVAAVLIIWAPSLGASFQFDDWNVIVKDSRVQSLPAWWHSMPGMRAVLKLSYALNHELDRTAGGGVAGFRSFNLLLHAINVLLVIALLGRLAGALWPQDSRRRMIVIATVATLFALHPVQTEAVTYISGRSSSLAATFSLLALWLWLTYQNGIRLHFAALRSRALLAASVAAFALALACKEIAVVVPIAMLLWLQAAAGKITRPQLLSLAPFGAVLALGLIVAITTLPYVQLFAWSLADRGPVGNLLTQAHGITYLIGQWLGLRPPNPDPMLPSVSALDAGTALRGAALLTALAVGLACLRRRPAIAFGILWFFTWLAPTNSILPRDDVANDRQLYLAMLGPAWLAGLALARLSRALPQRLGVIAAAAVIGALGVALALGTLRHNRIYADEAAFWEHVLQQSPQNARAANNLGMAYAIGCRRDEAVAAFARAIAIRPDDPQAMINRGLLLRNELPGVPQQCHAL